VIAPYPPLDDRISAIKSVVLSHTVADHREHVASFIREYDLIVTGLISLVSEATKGFPGEAGHIPECKSS